MTTKFCIAWRRFCIFIFHATICFPQVRREGQAANDRHRQPGLPPGNGGRVRRHGLEPRRLRHQRLSQVLPGLQRRQQEGPRQDERRIQRSSHRRVRRPEAQDVLHLGGRRPREEKGERHLEEDDVEDVSRRTTSRMLHASYRTALFDEVSSKATMQRIVSKIQRVFTKRLTKTSLSPYDDKRYVLDDAITTLAYGHYAVDLMIEEEDNA